MEKILEEIGFATHRKIAIPFLVQIVPVFKKLIKNKRI